ncbi:MAG TPA: PIN domain-containing protein [Candidatus Limnocylindria bacterium]|nr:PIN domain-containing protein [Candidatus Limnocylindria bacterium]
MISLDTSVVVRYLVGTPVDQAARAARLVEGGADVGISALVLAETAHVLRSNYGISRPDVIAGLLELITRANVAPIELSKSDVIDALVRARAYDSSPVTDALIAASARAYGALPVYTFDKKFGRLGVAVKTP